MDKRNWSDDMINLAISEGKKGSTINMANGTHCTVYTYPGKPNQYVIIETISRKLVQLSDFSDNDWIPDQRIDWYN